jgi:hypothetical protein
MRPSKEVKCSLILSQVLYQQVHRACDWQKMTFCALMRMMLADHLAEYLETPSEPGTLLPWAGAEPGDPLGQAVAAAARWWRLAPNDMAKYILAENVAAYIERGRRAWDEVAVAANDTTQNPAKAAPTTEPPTA